MSEFIIGLSVGLGMVLGLFLSETLGITAGGIIVPGWIALSLHQPFSVFITFIISIAVFLIVRGLSKFMIIYGKRRLVLSLLLGFLFGYLYKSYIVGYLSENFDFLNTTSENITIGSIGHIIPGLIANHMDRQGVINTISVILITASIVQLIIILITNGRVINV